jgi:mono/diheme cytochrome c family protein
MFTRALTGLVVVFVVILGLEAQAELRTEPSTVPQATDTANLYRVNCQMCHGPNGKALIPEMAFVGRKWKHGTKSTDMIKVITEGVKGTPMLPFKSKFTPVQIKALARYVRAFDKSLPPEK